MKMNRNQWIFIAGFLAFFGLLYFGLDKKPSEQAQIEKSRAINFEKTDVVALKNDAFSELSADTRNELSVLEHQLNKLEDTTKIISQTEQIAGKWYQVGYPEISGHFAKQLAEIDPTADRWSMVGTTYALALKRDKSDDVKDYCTKNAIDAFEKASSLEPKNLDHRINKALVYTDHPPAENPMKGVLALINLNEKHPDNVNILTQLGRLALQTGQLEKAKERLGRVLELDPNNQNAVCLLVSVYQKSGDNDRADEMAQKCELIKK